jgi:hypothetical protein
MKVPQPEPHPRPFPEPGDPRRRPDLPPRPEPQPDGTPDPEPRPRPAASTVISRLSTLSKQAGAGLLCLLPACDYWRLSINSEGLFLAVVIVGDDDRFRHRYRIRARDSDGTTRTLELPQSGQLPFNGFAPGPIEITLLVPEPCQVSGPNPRMITGSSAETVTLSYEVRC